MPSARSPVDPDIPRVAALLSDPSRVAMLLALADGRALPAGQLARCASISAPTASEHLARLTAAGLVHALRQGRHRYFRLAGEHVAAVVEALAAVAPSAPPLTERQSRVACELRAARFCFGHLAGVAGVGLSSALVDRGVLRWSDAGYEVTEAGWRWLAGLGVDTGPLRAQRPAVRTCHVDWSERRPHVGGPFGVALARWLVESGRLVRVRESRALRVTERGARWFREMGVRPSDAAALPTGDRPVIVGLGAFESRKKDFGSNRAHLRGFGRR